MQTIAVTRSGVAAGSRSRLRALAVPALLGAALATFAIFGATAQDRGTPEQQQACTQDVFRLCSAEIPNEPRIVACLKARRAQLSLLCRQVFNDPLPRARSRVVRSGKQLRTGKPLRIVNRSKAQKKADNRRRAAR